MTKISLAINMHAKTVNYDELILNEIERGKENTKNIMKL